MMLMRELQEFLKKRRIHDNKTQPFIAEIGFVVGSVAKRGMYKATVLAALFLTEILMALGFILLMLTR